MVRRDERVMKHLTADLTPFALQSGDGVSLRDHHFLADRDDVFEVLLHEPPAGLVDRVPEDFVQEIWERHLFSSGNLSTADGKPVTILNGGSRNFDTGPDFLRATLRIDGVNWIGDVEIHVTSGQWNEHRHGDDPRYNSVVLHVVLEADMWTNTLRREDGSLIPELVLLDHIETPVRRLLHDYRNRRESPIVCAPHWRNVPSALIESWTDELARQRIERKAERIHARGRTEASLEQHLFERIMAALGYSKNAEPMLDLARRVPLSFLLNDIAPDDVEACLLGTAGLIPHPSQLLEADRETADHAMMLRERFERLRHKFDLVPLPREAWQFFRLRPANFPPRRLAQAAALLQPGHLLRSGPIRRLRAAGLSTHPLRNLRKCFYTSVDSFWSNHVRLEKKSKPVATDIGRQRIDVILVNAVLPFLYYLGMIEQEDDLRQAAMKILTEIPGGSDEVIRIFNDLGSEALSASAAQGYHELYREYCTRMRCLTCDIGKHVLLMPS